MIADPRLPIGVVNVRECAPRPRDDDASGRNLPISLHCLAFEEDR